MNEVICYSIFNLLLVLFTYIKLQLPVIQREQYPYDFCAPI